MKRAAHILIILSMIWSTPCIAQKVSAGQARIVAKNFFQEKLIRQNYTYTGSPSIKSTFIKEHKGSVMYYVIQYKNGGFVIVTANKDLVPVLGFSFDGIYDTENQSPAQRSWMRGYEEQIIHSIERPYEYDYARSLWQHYLYMDPADSTEQPSSNSAGPLLHSYWEQGSRYNAYCPSDPAGPSGHTFTGCVATAMAQVMYYFRHPVSGNGSLSYFDPDYDTISADFGNTQYRWNEMVPWIMGQENTAIAELIYHCGVSVKTYYGPEGSGANTSDCVQSLAEYFKYKPSAAYYYRTHDDISWKDSLFTNLDNGQPIIYRGGAFWSAHCFVCDGYADTSYFHFNFGWWQGSGNGYYYLDDLTPFYISLTDGQAGIFNIFPDGDYPPLVLGTTTLTSNRGTLSDGSGPLNYQNNMDSYWLISPDNDESQQIMLYFNEFDTESGQDILTIYDGDNINAPVLGQFSGNALPPTITSSGSTLLIHFESNQHDNDNGWLAHYSTINGAYCQPWRHLIDTTGYVYDGSWIIYDYTNNSDCYWLVDPDIPEYDSISGLSLSFSEFETEINADYLRIYDGPTINDPLLAEISGNTLPDEIISSSTALLVWFSSNEQKTYRGFMASYHSIFPVYCRDTTSLTTSSGILGDGSGEKYYNHNSDCYWMLSPPDAEYISLSFNSFDVETGYDWLKIYDPAVDPPEELVFLTGNQIPEPLIFNKPEILIQFHSDHLIKKPGWELKYTTNNLGIDTELPGLNLQIYPNPCADAAHLRYVIHDIRYLISDLYSISGRKIRELIHEKHTPGEYEMEIDVSDLPAGVYFIRIQNGSLIEVQKMIVQH